MIPYDKCSRERIRGLLTYYALSEDLDVLNGTKQGCMLAQLLFSIFFAMMLIVVFNDCDLGTGVQFRTDGNVLDVRRLQARTKVHTYVTSCLPTTALWLPMPFMRYS